MTVYTFFFKIILLTQNLTHKMNISRVLRRACDITLKPGVRLTSTLPKPAEEAEPDKLYKIVELELRGHDPAVLKSFVKFTTTTGNHLDLESKTWNLRKPIHDRRSVLKCVHIYKKHQVQYETRTYFSFVQFKHLTGSTADTILEYFERNLPEGVALKATKVELQRLPEHLKSP